MKKLPDATRSSLPIGVFDSGLGGLTVVKELIRHLPHEEVIYVGDTARVPYGTKSPDTIRRYAMQISFFLLQKKVKALVVACNSVSAVALRSLRDLPVPVVGVIDPGARAAIMATQSNKVGVIGTRATVTSHAYQAAIRSYSRKVRVFEQACPLLVPLVEEGWLNHPVTTAVVSDYLKPLIRSRIDTLVLGCTHYPLLKQTLQQVVGKNVTLIDSADQTAKEVHDVLQKNNLLNNKQKSTKPVYFVTDNPASFERLGRQFLGSGITPARRLTLDAL